MADDSGMHFDAAGNRRACTRSVGAFVPFPKGALDKSIQDRFEERVLLHPDRIAARTRGCEWTYVELNRHINRIAHALLGQGAQPGHRIALLLEHDALPIGAFIAVLKVGGLCVPLEPFLPEARVRYILQDSETDLFVTNDRNLSLALSMAAHGERVVNVDRLMSSIPSSNPGLAVPPESLACLIYTSGSTGRPKGVLQTHRNVLHDVWGYTNGLGVRAEDRICLLASCSVGSGIKTSFNALLNGATLLPFNVKEEGVAGLGQWLQQEEISIYISAATVFRHLMSAISDDQRFPAVRLVRLASEPVRRSDYECFRKHFSPECIFASSLSSSETGNFTQYVLPAGSEMPGSGVPVGYAVEDKEVVLLDDAGRNLGPGCVGEIAVKSAYLSPGYWRRPDLTAAAFLPVPGDAARRLYRTGDLGFLHPDGCLEHRGRKGFQIKIRGYRVEMDEVGSVLRNHPSVRDAVVQAREMESGETRLVAYVVPRGNTPKPADLRRFLKESLPDPMLPAAFVFLDAIPLAPSGKPDRQALPPPPDPSSTLEDTFVPPRNAVEEALAAVWADVLHLKSVGVFDSFFDLGGHSLTATQVTSRLRRLFQVDLSLSEFLQQPTVAGLAPLIEERRGQGPGAAGSPIVPIPRDAELPLSFAQQRLWFLNQLTPGDPVYNLSRAVRLGGSLDQSALERSLSEIIRRHETLRTIFPASGGRPSQKILEPRAMQLQIVDLCGLPPDEAEAEGQRLVVQAARRPHALQEEPPFRALLIRLKASEHLLLLTLHHIVSDRWSRWILTQELGTLYEAFSAGKPSPLAELPIQYADFAHWQREWLSGDVLERQMSYWRTRLGGGVPALELPTDRPRAPVQSSRGATRAFVIPEESTRRLRRFSRQEGVTPFMTLLATFQAMLHRYTGQDDFAVGSPIANRNRMETEGLVGFFVNTLVLRADLSGDPTFRQLVARVREVALEAYAHQDLPFEKIVEELKPERRSNRTPMFQVMFVLQNAPSVDLQLTGQKLSPVDVALGTAMFDLTLSMFETPDSFRGVFEYNTDLFDPDTIAGMEDHLRNLLEGATAHPDQRVSELPFLTEDERERLVVGWNSTDVAREGDPCLHELFEAQVARTPGPIALSSEQGSLTYRELDERAHLLAVHLRRLGVGPEVAVGIYLERSLEMVTAILGTLKAGGIYVPLDPGIPRSRLDFIVADAGMAVLLTQHRLRPSLPSSSVQVLCLDSEAHLFDGQSRELPPTGVRPDNLAYIIYTSGSTGKPKGVMVTHRSISNYTQWIRTAFDWGEADRFLLNTPITFDCSACDLFPPLSVGARVFVVPPGKHRDVEAIVGMMQEHRITSLQVVPSMLSALLDHPGFSQCPSLRRVLCGGEALPREYADRFRACMGAELYNLYGPTEVTIDATCHPVRMVDASPNVPIGRPIANVRVYILDRYRNPLPVGVPGEIYIAGAGLARGYLNRPELTDEVFLPNPFSGTPGARLYRSGDLGRRLPDGNIEFLGRIDTSQVKLRGFRIELGEIEACLSRHPRVKENAVLCREDNPGGKRLVAYLVPRQGETLSGDELRTFLGQKLPEYMIPSVFVTLGSLPLMSNGKLDRSAFPPPEIDRREMCRPFAAPRTPGEALMAGIWAEVLGIERVGIHDNFFELGGHSLLAIQLISRLKDALQIDLPLIALFENPTVAGLMEQVAS